MPVPVGSSTPRVSSGLVLAELLTSVVNKMWYRMDDKLKRQVVEFDWSKLVEEGAGVESWGRDKGGTGGTQSMSGQSSMHGTGGVDAAKAASVTSSSRNSPRTPPRVRPPPPRLDVSKCDWSKTAFPDLYANLYARLLNDY